ncbi:hypothetical protein GUITHDRAFT_113904 [Guillardia theta CCMP2712]|uniref:Uncharacterized protein n=1 Tax=Guillardia theta (strain CCMP2712) TaxID=905079 RepID=L1IUZ5_GUITC|nr:hypothetical protein GUITHDRAFT_113904 [Guillardia theta CCMP2712]EKX39912.1 hypothetical protein GUITHDRAFT_113904 [Guillardia theta CCMP2712]|eukprot:XP_005826892.1 hypothetical protein GUITHDRAFT_113904 [Guillardia theta CCMP2712]
MLRFYVVQSIVLGIVVHELLAISRGVRKKTLRLSQISQDELLDSPFLTRTSLGLLRLAIGIFELGLIAHRCLMGPADNKFCNVVDEGKHCVPYGGIWLFATFTIWSWVGQGIYFFIIGLAPFVNLGRRSWLQQTLWVLYEIMFPMAILVTVVVWLVLVPYLNKAVEDGRSRNIETHQLMQRVLYSFSGLSFHCLNLVFMLLEFSLNKISIERAHRPFILLFGCAYVEFATVFHSLFGVW